VPHTRGGSLMKKRVARDQKLSDGCQVVAILSRFALQSLVIVCPYFMMNQSNMWRNTLFGCFMQISSYVLQIAFGRFVRKTSERAKFIVTVSARVFLLRPCVAFRLLHLLVSFTRREVQNIIINPLGMGSNLKGTLDW
jgi:hypothetical protein